MARLTHARGPWWRCALALLLGMAAVGHAMAEGAFPSKPVRLVVPYSAGGASDALARYVGLKLGEIWGQQVVVENRPGGGTAIGALAVAHVPLTPAQKARNPDIHHPMAWPHPHSGRECLYVNEGTTFGIRDMAADEAEALLGQLCAHIVRPELVYHHKWRVGDVLVWDNYSTQHKVSFNFGPERRRRMHRATVG
jgi:hypothetical protein